MFCSRQSGNDAKSTPNYYFVKLQSAPKCSSRRTEIAGVFWDAVSSPNTGPRQSPNMGVQGAKPPKALGYLIYSCPKNCSKFAIFSTFMIKKPRKIASLVLKSFDLHQYLTLFLLLRQYAKRNYWLTPNIFGVLCTISILA